MENIAVTVRPDGGRGSSRTIIFPLSKRSGLETAESTENPWY